MLHVEAISKPTFENKFSLKKARASSLVYLKQPFTLPPTVFFTVASKLHYLVRLMRSEVLRTLRLTIPRFIASHPEDHALCMTFKIGKGFDAIVESAMACTSACGLITHQVRRAR
eukprot:5642972-Amphidinium_carterae.1